MLLSNPYQQTTYDYERKAIAAETRPAHPQPMQLVCRVALHVPERKV